ncbi:MAG: helix-turn-helix domain-containing protein [Cryobacterium sp.]|nr:helix-turn-helix domain-containing protein [Cryobacterium sp.]
MKPDAIFVDTGQHILTSAGVSAGIDLALALVEQDHGAGLARDVARSLVVFLHRAGGQSQFSARAELLATGSSTIRAVLDSVTSNPTSTHTLTSMAQLARVSTRHLTRLFQTELGMTPSRFLELTRVEAAQRLLLGGASVTSAARASGFGSDEVLRRAFQRAMGVTPSTYRARFTSTRA